MHPTYIKAAYKKTILRELQRVLEAQYMDKTGTAREQLLCQEVLYAHRVVSQDVLQDVFADLEDQVAEQDKIISRFDFRERTSDERPAAKQPQAENPKPRGGRGKGRNRASETPSQ